MDNNEEVATKMSKGIDSNIELELLVVLKMTLETGI
jgi:hypothetical protein